MTTDHSDPLTVRFAEEATTWPLWAGIPLRGAVHASGVIVNWAKLGRENALGVAWAEFLEWKSAASRKNWWLVGWRAPNRTFVEALRLRRANVDLPVTERWCEPREFGALFPDIARTPSMAPYGDCIGATVPVRLPASNSILDPAQGSTKNSISRDAAAEVACVGGSLVRVFDESDALVGVEIIDFQLD